MPIMWFFPLFWLSLAIPKMMFTKFLTKPWDSHDRWLNGVVSHQACHSTQLAAQILCRKLRSSIFIYKNGGMISVHTITFITSQGKKKERRHGRFNRQSRRLPLKW